MSSRARYATGARSRCTAQDEAPVGAASVTLRFRAAGDPLIL